MLRVGSWKQWSGTGYWRSLEKEGFNPFCYGIPCVKTRKLSLEAFLGLKGWMVMNRQKRRVFRARRWTRWQECDNRLSELVVGSSWKYLESFGGRRGNDEERSAMDNFQGLVKKFGLLLRVIGALKGFWTEYDLKKQLNRIFLLAVKVGWKG